jgi:hypothetical protein
MGRSRLIHNADIVSDAAISLSKIATGTLPSAMKIADANVDSAAAIALSKLATGAIPTAWTVAAANMPATLGTYVDVPITNAACKTLYSVRATLLAAPASGFAHVLDAVSIRYTYATAAFTIGTAGNLEVRYTNGSGTVLATVASAGFLDQAASAARAVGGIMTIITPTAAAALVLSTATADMTDGGTSSMNVRIYYHTVPTV